MDSSERMTMIGVSANTRWWRRKRRNDYIYIESGPGSAEWRYSGGQAGYSQRLPYEPLPPHQEKENK